MLNIPTSAHVRPYVKKGCLKEEVSIFVLRIMSNYICPLAGPFIGISIRNYYMEILLHNIAFIIINAIM